jgi:SPP1 gp7 family putative phage head morphogenesis protein
MRKITPKALQPEKLKPGLRGQRKVNAKTVPRYPEHAERGYIGVVNTYMEILYECIEGHTEELEAALSSHSQGDFNAVYKAIMHDFNKRTYRFAIARKITTLAYLGKKLAVSEWKKAVHKTLGINILEDYYNGEFFRQTLQTWVENNVALITSIPEETLLKMQYVIEKGFKAGMTNDAMKKRIKEIYGVSESRARFIARDQTAKLNAQVTRKQHEDAGVTEYVWRTTGDQRVRKRHAELNSKRFKYSDPPIVDFKTGRRENPGGDFQCRCVALPVFILIQL